MIDMTGPQPPNTACFGSFAALYHADLRDVAAAVLWVAYAQKLGSPVPTSSMSDIERQLSGAIPEMARVVWGRQPPAAATARHVLYEAIQVLELNCLLYRTGGTVEMIRLTRTGRAAILSGEIRAYLVR